MHLATNGAAMRTGGAVGVMLLHRVHQHPVLVQGCVDAPRQLQLAPAPQPRAPATNTPAEKIIGDVIALDPRKAQLHGGVRQVAARAGDGPVWLSVNGWLLEALAAPCAASTTRFMPLSDRSLPTVALIWLPSCSTEVRR